MGEELFDEHIICTNSGHVFVRGGYGRKDIIIGVSSGCDEQPDVVVKLSSEQQRELYDAVRTMQRSGHRWPSSKKRKN